MRFRASLPLLALAVLAGTAPPALAAGGPRPNVVVIMTDDQPLSSMGAVPRARRLIGDRGAAFENSFVQFPLCCPSRATLLTGQYAHNNGVRSNFFPEGGYRSLNHKRTLAVALKRAGYETAMVGRYLNGYGPKGDRGVVPPGWTRWFGLTRRLPYYQARWNVNGEVIERGRRPRAHTTNLINRRATAMVRRLAPKRSPFFLWVPHVAPHQAAPFPDQGPTPADGCEGEARPAPRHADTFPDAPLPMPPSFNEADVSDKPSPISSRPSLTAEQIAATEHSYRCQLRALVTVDQGVADIVRALRRAGELNNTFLFFTSDNGYLRGEHRVRIGKQSPYEPSIRVPLLVRGPGIAPGTQVSSFVSNADLAPTIARLAGARLPRRPDGRPLTGLIRRPARLHGRELLIESQVVPRDLGGGKLVAIRNHRYEFVLYANGERELYDLHDDPHQLQNRSGDPGLAVVEAQLERRLERLRECRAGTCRRRPDVSLRARRLERGRPGCAGDRVRVRLAGAAQSFLDRARLRLGRSVRVLDGPPFRTTLPWPRGSGAVRATMDLVDGRRLTTRDELRGCRG